MSQSPQTRPPLKAKVQQASRTSGKAITSLVLGISSFMCMFLTGLIAIIFGVLALMDIKKGRGRVGGQPLAIVGIVLGVLGCLWTIPVLVMMLLPAVQQVRAAAVRTDTQNRIRQMALAMHNYESAHMHFPNAMPDPNAEFNARPALSWRVQVLPFIEENNLYDQFNQKEGWDSSTNKPFIEQMPDVYKSVSHDLPAGHTMFRVPYNSITAQNKGAFFRKEEKVGFGNMTDGSSNTILIVETNPEDAVIWTKPDELQFDYNNPKKSLGKAHPGITIVAMGDGSSFIISNQVSDEVLKAMFTANGGEVAEF